MKRWPVARQADAFIEHAASLDLKLAWSHLQADYGYVLHPTVARYAKDGIHERPWPPLPEMPFKSHALRKIPREQQQQNVRDAVRVFPSFRRAVRYREQDDLAVPALRASYTKWRLAEMVSAVCLESSQTSHLGPHLLYDNFTQEQIATFLVRICRLQMEEVWAMSLFDVFDEAEERHVHEVKRQYYDEIQSRKSDFANRSKPYLKEWTIKSFFKAAAGKALDRAGMQRAPDAISDLYGRARKLYDASRRCGLCDAEMTTYRICREQLPFGRRLHKNQGSNASLDAIVPRSSGRANPYGEGGLPCERRTRNGAWPRWCAQFGWKPARAVTLGRDCCMTTSPKRQSQTFLPVYADSRTRSFGS